MPLGALVTTRSLGCSMVACRLGKPTEMALSDGKLYLILEIVALVGVMVVVVVEATGFCCVSSCHIFSDRCRPSVRSIVYRGLKYFCSRAYQTCVVGKLGLVLQVLRPFAVVARGLLGPLVFLLFAAASPILDRVFFFLRAVLFGIG